MSLLLRFRHLVPLAAVLALPVIGSAACNAQIATVLDSDAGSDSSTGGGGGGGAVCTNDAECNDDPTVSSIWGTCTGGVCTCKPGFTKQASGRCNTSTTTSPECAAKGGVCVPPGGTPPKSSMPLPTGCTQGSCWVPIGGSPTTGPVCYKDQDCNSNPSVSSLSGKCFYGVCMCHSPYTVQPNGKCDTPGPLDCTAQKGTCRQMPAECQAFELRAQEAPMSCGDFVESVCCVSSKLCNGPGREIPGGGFSPVDFVCCPGNDATHAPICINGWRVCPGNDVPTEAASCPGG